MEGIQTLTIERHITNEKFKTIFEGDVKKVVLSKFYDLHGTEIPQGKETFKNCHVRIVEHSYKEFGKRWKFVDTYVDGQSLDVEVVTARGDTGLLELRGCTGAG